VEIRGLGGAAFERALEHFRGGGSVTYRGMELALRAAAFECRVPWPNASGAPKAPEALTERRALEALTGARFRLGALLASAPPLAAIVGNREPRLVLVGGGEPATDLFELRGDRLRRLPGRPP